VANMKNQSLVRRFFHAANGIRWATRVEASFRTQLLVVAATAVVLALLRPPLLWIALCILSAGMVLALELVNTALEHLADGLHPEQHPAIQVAKDCAAGAVLLASIAALLVGVMTVAVARRWLPL